MTRIKYVLLVFVLACAPLWAQSYYRVRPDDAQAVYLTAAQFGVQGDGIADDSDAIQKAINELQQTKHEGIVLIPEGRYRISKTIYVWPSIRLIGYGANRPVFVLAKNTPGFQDKSHENYMIFFSGEKPGVGRRHNSEENGGRPPDANPGTFYSAMSNIDVEIAEGNPGAVGVRGTYAQHCFLAHMNFKMRSGIAGVHDTGNVMEDVKFFGGEYGIWTRKPSPGWQFTAVDTEFDGQSVAAIRETEAGLTLIRPHFHNVPTAISIDANSTDALWLKDGVMENVSGPAVLISMEQSARTQINMENVACHGVPTFASFRESGKKLPGASAIYVVKTFSHGLAYSDISAVPEVRDLFDVEQLKQMPEPVKSDLVPLPPAKTWVNVRTLGAKGDGHTDDTAVFRSAIGQHKAIYLPGGRYVVSDTLVLKPDTVLIGLDPSTTQIDLLDGTPAFQGVGSPKAVIEAPQGGTNVLFGIGIYTNGMNPRAVGVKWMAGKDSMMNDVRFLGGHGTNAADGSRENPYNNTHTGDPDLSRRWDAQYPSLWVTNGGGGTFFDIWTPSTFAQAGMLVSDTATEGRVYEMSSEHHVRHEIQLHNVSNWEIYSLQTEEEWGEGGLALPLEIDNSSNITIANLFMYRVIRSFQPFPWAVKVSRSSDIRFRNFHCFSNSKVSFDNGVYDQTHNIELRQREFAWLTLTKETSPATSETDFGIVAPGARMEKLAGGFFNASGGAVAPNGDFYFADPKRQRIYRWNVADGQLTIVRDAPLDPINLAFDKAGHLMVISYSGKGTVYWFDPNTSGNEVGILKPVSSTPNPNLTAVLPVSDWELQRQKSGCPLSRPFQYLSPDGTTFISATAGFIEGVTSWGVLSSDLLRSFSLAAVKPGSRFYITSESEGMTWSALVGSGGDLSDWRTFAHQGGEGVTTDADGNVYLVAGQVYVYRPDGKLIGTIQVPERPLQAAFGGKDGHTLFILGRTSLYSIRTNMKRVNN